MKYCYALKRCYIFALCVCVSVFFLIPLPAFAESAVPSVSAQNGAILMDADTGDVLFEQNADVVAAMASTTKIMSAWLALESGDLDTPFVVDENAIKVEGSSMGLQPGDQVTMRDLCYGMMLPSGNDAANAAAVKIAGSIDNFVAMMNERAKQINMTQTVFATPSGLDNHQDHHSSARDMATLARAAMQNADFREIVSCKSKQLCFGNPPYRRTLYNHNKLLSMYPGAIGVKTGFTDKAGRCLVSAAQRDGVTLIAVVLKDPSDWKDSMAMFDYGFSKVHSVSLPDDFSQVQLNVVGGAQPSVKVVPSQTMQCCLTDEQQKAVQVKIKTDPLYYAPVHKGDVVGKAEYILGARSLGEVELLAESDVLEQQATLIPMGFYEVAGSLVNSWNTVWQIWH